MLISKLVYSTVYTTTRATPTVFIECITLIPIQYEKGDIKNEEIDFKKHIAYIAGALIVLIAQLVLHYCTYYFRRTRVAEELTQDYQMRLLHYCL